MINIVFKKKEATMKSFLIFHILYYKTPFLYKFWKWKKVNIIAGLFVVLFSKQNEMKLIFSNIFFERQ